MPRPEHEPWCEDHIYDDVEGPGVCKTQTMHFGAPYDYGAETLPRGFLSADRRAGDRDIDIYVDYLSGSGGGLMDVGALRGIREAVAESPGELLAALDAMIAELGDEVPPALRRPERVTA